MPLWLLLEAQLRFNPSLKSIFPENYRADLLADASDVYYGVHFVAAPSEIKPGDQVVAELLLRAYPEDPCIVFQAGKKVYLKEGSLVRADGTILRRWEHESDSRTLAELQKERAGSKSNPQ